MEFKSYAEEEEEYEEKNAENWYAYNAPPSQGGRKRKKAHPPSQGGRKRAKTSDALFDSDEETEMPNQSPMKALCRQRRQRQKEAHAKAKADAAAKQVDKQAAKISSKAKRAVNRAAKAATRQTPAALAKAEAKRLSNKADSRALSRAIRRTPKTTSALPIRQRLPRYGRHRLDRKTPTHVAAAATAAPLQSEAEEGKLLYRVIAMLHFTMLD
jgi:hypothetical protein